MVSNPDRDIMGHQLQILWMFPSDFGDDSHPFFHSYMHNILGATHATQHKPIVPSLDYVPYCNTIVIGGLEHVLFSISYMGCHPSH